MARKKKFTVSAIIKGVDKLSGPVRKAARTMKRVLGRALRGVKRMAMAAGAALKGMLGSLGLIGGAAIIGGIAALANSFSKAGDDIAKFARQVGISVEALQEYQFAADRSGVDGGTFRKSLETLSKRLGEARIGTGALNTTLNKLPKAFGETLKAAKSTDEALGIALGAIGAIADESDRAALATSLFGRSGAQMALLAAEGADGIDKLRQEARDLGLVMSTKAAKGAEEFVDRMTDFKAAVSGVKIAIGTELLPVLRPMLVDFTRWIVANREIIGQKVGAAVRGIVEWVQKIDFGKIVEDVKSFFGGVSDIVEKLGGVGPIIEGIAVLWAGSMLGPIGSIAAAVYLIVNNWDAVTAAIDKASDALLDYIGIERPEEAMTARAKLTGGQLKRGGTKILRRQVAEEESVRFGLQSTGRQKIVGLSVAPGIAGEYARAALGRGRAFERGRGDQDVFARAGAARALDVLRGDPTAIGRAIAEGIQRAGGLRGEVVVRAEPGTSARPGAAAGNTGLDVTTGPPAGRRASTVAGGG
jgi:hypothetical protein